jgi:molybdenum cofactor cytidylyltransferase
LALSAAARVAGVVLAAGLSTRMGRNKQLLMLDGEAVVARAARTAFEAGLAPVLLVVGHEADLVRAAVAQWPVIAIDNPDPARGIHSSLRAGFTALGEHAADAEAAVVMLGDMPLVTAAMVKRLVDQWQGQWQWHSKRAPLAISLYDDVVAPPILYDAALFAEICALEDEGCGKRVIKRHRAEALKVQWPAWALADLDEPADLMRAELLLGRARELG